MGDDGGEAARTEAQDGRWPPPNGWCWATVDEVAQVNPRASETVVADDKLVTFLPMPSVEAMSGRIDRSEKRRFADVKKGFTRFRDGDVLFAKITPSMENGKMAVATGLEGGFGCGTTEFHVIRPANGMAAEFLRHYLQRVSFRTVAKRNMAGAVGQQRVPPDFLRQAEIPIAPAAEQARIAEKIDSLFAQIEAGEAALAEARRHVARYRKSVLKAAVTGALTADWRAENTDAHEDGETLRTRLLAERRAAWERDQVDKAKAKGKPLKGEAWKAKYKPPVEPVTEGLPALPEGWVWASFDALNSHLTSGSRDWKQYYGRGEGTFIMAQNVRPLRFDLSERFLVDPPMDGPDAIRSQARRDDLLITIVGANTGDVCRFPIDEPGYYVCQSVALARPVQPDMSRFMELYLASEGAGKDLLDKFIYGAGRPHLSFEQLRTVAIPLPPPAEQAEIVARVEAALAEADRLDVQLDAQSRASKGLRQSVLKAAFEGRLVPQDPDDEPASALLERIKAERAERPKVKQRRKAAS